MRANDSATPTPLQAALASLDLGDNPGLAWADPVQSAFDANASAPYGYVALSEL